MIGYAEITSRLTKHPNGAIDRNPYKVWIAECARKAYQAIDRRAGHDLDRLAGLSTTPAREAELITIFREASRLEAAFWEMGWCVGRWALGQPDGSDKIGPNEDPPP